MTGLLGLAPSSVRFKNKLKDCLKCLKKTDSGLSQSRPWFLLKMPVLIRWSFFPPKSFKDIQLPIVENGNVFLSSTTIWSLEDDDQALQTFFN